MSQELIIKDKPKAPQLTLEQLPPLKPQQALMLHYIIEGSNYTEAYRKAGYSSVDHADKAAWHLVTRNPLKAHLEYFRCELAKMCTPDYLINKLNHIIDAVVNRDDSPLTYNPEVAIKAIAEINKMQGNYAQTQAQVNHLHASIDDIRNARDEYKKGQ